MSISTTGECVSITIGMKDGNPIITKIHTEGLVANKTILLEEGMEVTSISYNGQCVFLGREKTSGEKRGNAKAKPTKKKMTHPFLDKKFKLEPGTNVIAVVMKTGAEERQEDGGSWQESNELFLVRGVTVGCKSHKKNSQHVEVLVYSIESMSDDLDEKDIKVDSDTDEYESVSNDSFSSEDSDGYDSFSDDDAGTDGSVHTVESQTVQTFQPQKAKFSFRPPPLGIANGGYWTTQKYVGRHTLVASVVGCFCLGFVGPMVLCCPFDERSIYIVDGRAYAESGKCVAFQEE
ncbi:expressed unknown protein [Seminavis robusta]|uniref:Uncharacterized protein n=1 Tax=Seminavis robusta TaxID=568900 RepID=A0A9N8E5L7_9STRA|nr:expressed unknown protein [Seminavis robusta]|eukprot:Sro686_g187130.1 n/a (291) ;mRNA; r:39385-40257